MNTVTFGTYNSYEDLDLILTKKTIGAASPKIAKIDIPGADGELDYTEYFGEINYYNRTISLEFSTITPASEFLQLYSTIQRLLNGRKMNIYFTGDSDFHYVGRITVNEWTSNGRIGKIVIDINAEPYKLKNAITVVSAIVSEQTTVNCPNLKKRAIPTITASTEVTVTFGTYQRVFIGSITDDDIIFTEGQNVLTITPANGTASVTIEYQEGEL